MATFYDYYFGKVLGGRREYKVVHKFGRNESVGTTYEPIALGGNYRTPQVGGATTLRVKAGGNANDTAGGSGARKVMLQGIDASGDEITEELTLAGASASSATTQSFIRLYRAWVSESGTYGTQAAGSHSAAITIEKSAGSEDWLIIGATNFPKGQSEVACYTVPNGWEAYVFAQDVHVDSTKTAEIIFFKREQILNTAAPYQAMRAQEVFIGVQGNVDHLTRLPLGPYKAQTDIGYMGRVASTAADISIEFEIVLVKV